MAMEFGTGTSPSVTNVDAFSSTFAVDGNWTIAFWIRCTTDPGTTVDNTLVYIASDGTGPSETMLQFGVSYGGASTKPKLYARNGSYSGPAQGNDGDLVVDQWQYFALVRNGTSSLKLFIDGVEICENTESATSQGDATSITIGAKSNYNAQDAVWEIAHYRSWTRRLTVAELAAQMQIGAVTVDATSLYNWLPLQVDSEDYSGNSNKTDRVDGTLGESPPVVENPYAITREPPADGGSSVEVTPAAASLTITGQVPTVELPVVVTPGNADIAIVGQIPTVATPVSVTPAAASLVVTGQVPTVAVPVDVTPASASLAITGQIPTVAVPVDVTPASASLAITGAAPAVSTPVDVTPAAASLAITGAVPTVATPRNAAPTAASLAITGYAPTVDDGSGSVEVTPAAASLTITGQVPTVTASSAVEVTPAAASLAITGQIPTVATPVEAAPGNADIAIVGQIPTVTATENVDVTPAAAALTITGQIPTLVLTGPVVVTPASASLAFSFMAPRVVATVTPAEPEEVEPIRSRQIPLANFYRAGARRGTRKRRWFD